MTGSIIRFSLAAILVAACSSAEQKGSSAPAPQAKPATDQEKKEKAEKDKADAKKTEQKLGSKASGSKPESGGGSEEHADDHENADARADLGRQSAAVTPGSSTPPAAEASDPNVVVFRIKAGTGSGPWNTANDPIRVRVGQTLTIQNDDSTQHWVHTNLGPFFHPFSGIAPGASESYQINNANSAGVHDHLTNAPIYMEVSQ